ncbi:alpha/beta hydrolase [Oceaniglobus ichthyenteri]|uniref:alpha/beta hydrolase n=1 Tax=Oceaniglobus ichthyenteri TaxID=2136177 RepID=UPI000D3664AD|nr:alpha/beta hydrolase [Oceaniglobus ichthyenteri]
MFHQVSDWDRAYSNASHIHRSDQWPQAWVGPAQALRDDLTAKGRAELDQPYGPGPRQRYDLFMPEGEPRGLFVFVHGGYWHSLDRSYWSHLAAGPVAHGYVVAVPGYTLCPEVRIRDIGVEIAAAVDAAAGRIAGPVVLAGHSAGGHLVARIAAQGSALSGATRARLSAVIPISGLSDLRPFLRLRMNDTLRLDTEETLSESPALLAPPEGLRVFCWVGGSERAEFLRQNRLLADIWTGLGAKVAIWEEPDRHHFDICDGLIDPDHPIHQVYAGRPTRG